MTRMLTVLSALLLAMPLAAQATALHGTWRGTGEDNEEEKLELRANGTAISGEDTMKWQFVRDGLIRFVADGESLDVPYELSGDRLVLVLLGDRYPYERVGARPPAPAGGATPPPNPLGGKAGGSAVAKPKADPFARRFAGENIALSLSRSTDGYTGELTFQGETYPVRATAEGHALRGTFTADGHPFPFEATRDGDKLSLRTGDTEYALEAPPLAEEAAEDHPANPLAGGSAPRPQALPALEGVAPASGSAWQHPRGWFTFEMPDGWSVWQETEDGILLNPGFSATDTLDALIVVRYGRLEEGERNLAVDELLDRNEAQIRQDLAGQGIQVAASKEKAKKVSVAEVPGAVMEWSGRTQNGQTVDVWCGALVKREYYLGVVAVLVDGKGQKFLPRIKRVFQTLRPTPPKANPQLAGALVGRRFANSETSRENSFHCSYEFRQGGQVYKNIMLSGTTGGGLGEVGGQTEQTGSYEVVGDEVFLYFKDGQESARVMIEGGAPVALQFGKKLYRAR